MQAESKGLRSAYASTSPTNQAAYQVQQQLRQIHTNFLGIVQSCESDEEKTGATTVSVIPAVQQTDGEGNALPMATIPKCPHTRYQHGICAVIIDPVQGDKVVCCAPKNDSTTISADTVEPQRPGSLREFSQSNSFAMGAVHTKTPENWVTLRQDKTRESYAPEGVLNRTDKTIREEMGEDHEWEVGRDGVHNFGQNLVISIGQDCTITIGGDKTVTISGNLNCVVTGNATLKAASVTIDAPQTTITGNVRIAGTLSQGEGGGGNATFGGSVTARGSIHSDADVTAGGISLNSHTHSGVEPGGGNTGAPQ